MNTTNNGAQHASSRSLGEAMSELAITLQTNYESVENTLQSITDSALTLIPGTTGACISLVIERRTVQSRAATSATARDVDQMQGRLGEGPYLLRSCVRPLNTLAVATPSVGPVPRPCGHLRLRRR